MKGIINIFAPVDIERVTEFNVCNALHETARNKTYCPNGILIIN